MVQGKGGEGVPSEEVLEQVMSCCVVGVYIGITKNVYWNNRLCLCQGYQDHVKGCEGS